MLWFFAVLPFVSTLLGGWAVLRLQHRLHPIMAFAAGVLVATALAELLPESSTLLGHDALLVGGLAVFGYVLFAGLEASLHRGAWEHQHDVSHPGDEDTPHTHAAPRMGVVGAAWMIVHSLLDGLAIGAAFRAGSDVGLTVGVAVLAHDFADGMNVTALALQRSRGAAIVMLALDAIAPPIGAALGFHIALPERALGMMLAVFAGAFLALGAGHLLPEAQHRKPDRAPRLVVLTAVGASLVLLIRHFAAV